MKKRNYFYLVAVSIVFAVFFIACTQTPATTEGTEEGTEAVIEKGDEAAEAEAAAESKCGAATESDTTAKCGEGKCGEGEGGEESKCGEG